MIKGQIRNKRFYVEEATDEELQALGEVLAIPVPGAEHTPLYKKGKWDGIKKLFDWRRRSFSSNLIHWVERHTKLIFETEKSDEWLKHFDFIPFKVKGEHELRDFQVSTIKSLLLVNSGLAAMATNAGKTGCIAGVIKALLAKGCRVGIMEGMEDLLKQVKEEIELSIGEEMGVFTAKKKELKQATMIMVPSAARAVKRFHLEEADDMDYEFVNWIREADALIVDECHHATAESYLSLMALCKGKMRFGFSGTVWEENTLKGILLREVFGDVVSVVSNKELIERDISAKPIIRMIQYSMEENFEDVVTQYRKSIQKHCFVTRDAGKDAAGRPIKKTEFSVPLFTNRTRKFVMDYSVRNSVEFKALVYKYVNKHADKNIVVLADWVEFAEEMAKALDCPVFHGETEHRGDIINDFKAGRIKKLVATSVMDEGLSIDNIDVLILATVGSSSRQFLQRLGRGLRHKVGANQLLVYDFVRFGHSYLIEPSRKRIALWKSQGFDIEYLEVA